MPIGVPKVPFRSPGEEDASWVDVYLINRLYRERLLFLGQEVDSEISNQLIGLMVYLSIEDDTKDLYLFINSPGGWVIPGVAIYDTIQFVQPDVHTICMGLAASMGSFIFTSSCKIEEPFIIL
uniref:ATP-dependent Clp protease proteolytic subunit n=1 Tax=Styrax dasyanthus TaxID=153530 RepID=A0A7G7WP61_9ERIC|nr:caseinolytic mitochondrial matrix peptidase proteolytic subunit [Styrax dasyanthus]QNH68338.1 caseinolytic mitochondrial matrix peptidase proteolytic subunit [Styrax dasyanthus]